MFNKIPKISNISFTKCISYFKQLRNISLILIMLLFCVLFSCKTETIPVYIYESQISLTSLPNKTEYFVGEKLDYTGLSVINLMENGKKEEVFDYKIYPEPGTVVSETGKQEIVITYKKCELKFSININPIENSALYVKQIPKSAYYTGEKLDLSNLELEVLKNNGTKENVTDFTSEPAEGTVLENTEDGKIKVTIFYGNISTSFDVSVYNVTLENLYIKKLPLNMNYYTGDVFDSSEMVVEAVFNDGTVKEISDYTVVPGISTPLTEIGKQTVSISYLDKTVDFEVTVTNSIFAFTQQPISECFELYSDNQTLSANILVDGNGTLSFSWYRKNPNEIEYTEIYKSDEQNVEFGEIYSGTVSLPKNNFVKSDYFCKATLKKGNFEKSVDSDSITVEQVINTKLPTIYLDTDDRVELVNKTDKVNSSVIIFDEDGNELLNSVDVTFGGRGNSSWGMPKKSYSLKFSSKTKVLGMNKSKKWVLIANYADKTLLRNDYAYYLGRNICTNMEWNPSFKSVNFIKNDEYLGTYLLGEQIKLEEARVNIQSAADTITGKSKYTDFNEDGKIDINDGGFIVEINARLDENFNFKTTKGICISLKDPDTDDFVDGATTLDEDVANYIKGIIQTAEDVLYSENYADVENGYAKYLDVPSFIDWWIVNELAKNNDASWFSSVYMYYNPEDQKLHMGPLWDFDIGFGNVNYNNCDNFEGFWIKQSGWHGRLFTDPSFIEKVKTRWNEVSALLETSILEDIPSKAEEISTSAQTNFTRWNILGSYVWPNPAGYAERTTYQSEVDYMIDWLTKRYKWLDTEIKKL